MPDTAIDIELVATVDCAPTLLVEIRSLLDDAFDDFEDHDWDHALGGVHVMARTDGVVVGHAAVVERPIEIAGRRLRTGYVEAVATRPGHAGRGIGRAVMDVVGSIVRSEHELGALCTGLDGYYERFGWERWLGPTWVRRAAGPDRSPDEDGLIFVLRHGPTATVDLAAPISCDERAGDDW